MFYETFSWWGLLILGIASGFFQHIGFHGRGRKSQKIELFSNLIIIGVFIGSFFAGGFWGGMILILLFSIVNTYLTEYLAKKYFMDSFGYVPSEKEGVYKQVLDEFMSKKIKDGFSPLDVEREVEKRLNTKD